MDEMLDEIQRTIDEKKLNIERYKDETYGCLLSSPILVGNDEVL
ncbi:hypothetical protein [Paenibacillus sp. sgz302251]